MRMKTAIIILSILALLVVVVVAVLQHPAFGRRVSAERKARIEASPNYRDGMFQNQQPTPQFTGDHNTLKAMWTMLMRRDSNRVPIEPIPAVKTDLKSMPKDRDWLVWFGHSSYLFCLNGKRYLVDPLLKMEFPASLMLKPFKGTDIYTPDDMPEIDVLIITHEHWDHLDYATLRDLRPKVKQVVCPLGVGEYLEYWKYDPSIIHEMDWMEELKIKNYELRITCLPSRHFSNRLLRGRNQTLWAAFMVEAVDRKVYIGGDGGYDDRFRQAREQFGKIDLAIMENGQYNPNWAYIHMLPQDLEQAILDMQPEQVFTVHHDKFSLSTHAWSEPDSVARSIAERNAIHLLDQPIGTVIYF
ncbi:MAG: MBL fold metallo-hydrolase [Paludibacteraceae bacterium]|nr:MBL fold metallo-hydrolase [Paludibacteraceae bacterium]